MADAVGITIMLETIQHHGLSPRLARLRWSMKRVKRGTMLSAALVLIIAVAVNLAG